MKKSILLVLLLLGVMTGQSQHLFEHTYPVITEEHAQIRNLMNKVSVDSLQATIEHLQSYHTRQWNSQMVYDVQDWLKGTYEAMDLDTVLLHDFPVIYHDSLCETSDNVIAVQRGTLYPDEYVVCGAHYDSYNRFGGDPDLMRAPGADDNASGVSGILETARLLSRCTFERSVIYCGFAAEEIGLVGSTAYARDCAIRMMDIVGYFNLDMIGYLAEGSDIHVNLLYRTRDSIIADYVYNFCDVYYPDMPVRQSWLAQGSDSDYSSFNRNGYASIQPFEDTHFPSPYIHTPDDILGLSVNNMDQVKRFTELNLGLVATLAGLVSDGLDENPDEAVMVYPNPASDIVTVKGMPVQEIHVYNRLGQRLLSRSFDNTEACTFDVSALTPDLYLVQVVGPQQVKAVKLTIDN